MKVLVLTVGDMHVASTQYRFGQFADGLREAGVELVFRPAVDFRDWPLAAAQDLVIVQKRLMRASWVKTLRKHAKLLGFDTDDAIWEPHGRRHSLWTRLRTNHRLRAIAGAADFCTVANEHLASHLRQLARRVEVIPMALDEQVWHPAADRRPGPPRIGWAGAPPNLTYLERLVEPLAEVRKHHPDTEFHVYCGKVPDFGRGLDFIHHPFEPGTEAEVVRSFDIGLLPLPDDAFAAGKSPIKALQYAACGIPCVASPVGAARELVRHGETGLAAHTSAEWSGALCRLLADAVERRRLGEAALLRFRQCHTRERVGQHLLSLWHAADPQKALRPPVP